MHTRRENNQKCEEAFKEMAETGKDILMQERGGTNSKTVNTGRNSYKRNFMISILKNGLSYISYN